MSFVTVTPADDLRAQVSNRCDGRSYLVLDPATGSVRARADRFVASFSEGTQRTYAYHLIGHLPWLAATGRGEDTVTIESPKRYMAVCGAEHPGPLGLAWRAARWGTLRWGCG